MNKLILILGSVLIISGCGPSQEERNRVAAVTCSIMGETRNMDAAVRVEKMNEARDKIGGEPFLRGDDAIKESFEWGLCPQLVLNENYDETLQVLEDAEQERKKALEDAEQERKRLAWQAGAEDRKIAAEKQRIYAEKKRLAFETAEKVQLSLGSEHVVEMLNSSEGGEMIFEPPVLKVSLGDTIHFKATDAAHNSVSMDGMIPSGAADWAGMLSNDISVVLDTEGVYVYQCDPHVMMAMIGVIQVGEAVNLDQIKGSIADTKSKFIYNAERLENYLSRL
ncbi:pseudoazurin [Gammaproteobacteria bacterium]|nr:pseudoazurin [Gammaproteobacteria bacterium]